RNRGTRDRDRSAMVGLLGRGRGGGARRPAVGVARRWTSGRAGERAALVGERRDGEAAGGRVEKGWVEGGAGRGVGGLGGRGTRCRRDVGRRGGRRAGTSSA